jgi:hypothetical protein
MRPDGPYALVPIVTVDVSKAGRRKGTEEAFHGCRLQVMRKSVEPSAPPSRPLLSDLAADWDANDPFYMLFLPNGTVIQEVNGD